MPKQNRPNRLLLDAYDELRLLGNKQKMASKNEAETRCEKDKRKMLALDSLYSTPYYLVNFLLLHDNAYVANSK